MERTGKNLMNVLMDPANKRLPSKTPILRATPDDMERGTKREKIREHELEKEDKRSEFLLFADDDATEGSDEPLPDDWKHDVDPLLIEPKNVEPTVEALLKYANMLYERATNLSARTYRMRVERDSARTSLTETREELDEAHASTATFRHDLEESTILACDLRKKLRENTELLKEFERVQGELESEIAACKELKENYMECVEAGIVARFGETDSSSLGATDSTNPLLAKGGNARMTQKSVHTPAAKEKSTMSFSEITETGADGATKTTVTRSVSVKGGVDSKQGLLKLAKMTSDLMPTKSAPMPIRGAATRSLGAPPPPLPPRGKVFADWSDLRKAAHAHFGRNMNMNELNEIIEKYAYVVPK